MPTLSFRSLGRVPEGRKILEATPELLQVPCVCHDTPLSLAILKLPSCLNQCTDAATEAQKRHGPASAPNKVQWGWGWSRTWAASCTPPSQSSPSRLDLSPFLSPSLRNRVWGRTHRESPLPRNLILLGHSILLPHFPLCRCIAEALLPWTGAAGNEN